MKMFLFYISIWYHTRLLFFSINISSILRSKFFKINQNNESNLEGHRADLTLIDPETTDGGSKNDN